MWLYLRLMLHLHKQRQCNCAAVSLREELEHTDYLHLVCLRFRTAQHTNTDRGHHLPAEVVWWSEASLQITESDSRRLFNTRSHANVELRSCLCAHFRLMYCKYQRCKKYSCLESSKYHSVKILCDMSWSQNVACLRQKYFHQCT